MSEAIVNMTIIVTVDTMSFMTMIMILITIILIAIIIIITVIIIIIIIIIIIFVIFCPISTFCRVYQYYQYSNTFKKTQKKLQFPSCLGLYQFTFQCVFSKTHIPCTQKVVNNLTDNCPSYLTLFHILYICNYLLNRLGIWRWQQFNTVRNR